GVAAPEPAGDLASVDLVILGLGTVDEFHRPGVAQDEGVVEPHSEDYSAPFGDHIGAYGLCYRCHMMVHCRFKKRAAWDRSRAAVRAGKRSAPIRSRNFPEFVKQLRGERVAFERCRPPVELVLDDIEAGRIRKATGPPADGDRMPLFQSCEESDDSIAF